MLPTRIRAFGMEQNNSNDEQHIQEINEVNAETKELTSHDKALIVLMNSGMLDKDGKLTSNWEEYLASLHQNGILKLNFSKQILWSELRTAGYKVCFIDENRQVYVNQVEKLYNDVKDSKRFDEVGKVVAAEKVLSEGLSLHDIEGRVVTKDTPGLDKYLAVIDAQHRLVVCHQHPEIDLFVEFDDYQDSTIKRIALLNNMRKDHTGQDQKRSIRKHYKDERTQLLEEMAEMQKKYGVTEKYSELILTMKKDQFKRNELCEIQTGKKEPDEKYQGNAEDIKNGKALIAAIHASFSDDSEHWRKAKKIEFPTILYKVFNAMKKDNRVESFDHMVMFLTNLPAIKKEEVVQNIGTDSLEYSITTSFGDYIREHNENNDWDSEEEKYHKVLEQHGVKSETISSGTKKLISGSPWEIIANYNAIEHEKAEKEAKKKQAEAERVKKQEEAKKAKEEKEAKKKAAAEEKAKKMAAKAAQKAEKEAAKKAADKEKEAAKKKAKANKKKSKKAKTAKNEA